MEDEIFIKDLRMKTFVTNLITSIVIFIVEVAVVVIQSIRFPATIDEGDYAASLTVIIIAAFCAGLNSTMIEYNSVQIIKLKKEIKESEKDI